MILFEKWIPIGDPVMVSGQQTKIVFFPAGWGTNTFVVRKKDLMPMRPGLSQSSEYKKLRKGLAALFYSVTPFAWKPIAGPIGVTIIVVLPHLKSTPKSMLDKLIPKATTPDADNATKIYFDALQPTYSTKNKSQLLYPGLIEDDKYIVDDHFHKYRGPNPGIYLKIEPADPQRIFDMVAEAAGWSKRTRAEYGWPHRNLFEFEKAEGG